MQISSEYTATERSWCWRPHCPRKEPNTCDTPDDVNHTSAISSTSISGVQPAALNCGLLCELPARSMRTRERQRCWTTLRAARALPNSSDFRFNEPIHLQMELPHGNMQLIFALFASSGFHAGAPQFKLRRRNCPTYRGILPHISP